MSQRDEVHTEELNGYKITIFQDSYYESPRDWDNLGTMVCWHRRYDLGDKHSFSEPSDFLEWKKRHDVIVLPLYLYDHSGITISTGPFSCPWDSGQVGYIYVEKDKVRKEWGWKHITKKRQERIEQALKQEVSTYDDYLTGNVYGYTVSRGDEELDSCGGFYGDYQTSGILEEARASVKYEEKKALPLLEHGGLL